MLFKVVHLGLLLYFLLFKWTRLSSFFSDVRLIPLTTNEKQLTTWSITMIMITSHFIGYIGAVGMLYNYGTWYFSSLPLLID